jgi:hypothetical protein
MVIGLVAACALQNARHFAQVDGWIQLFHIDDRPRNGFRIAMALAPCRLCPPIYQSQHPFDDKAPSFVAHHGSLDPGVTTALSSSFSEEDNRPDDLVIVWDGIDTLPPNVLEIFLSRHEIAPFGTPSVLLRLC